MYLYIIYESRALIIECLSRSSLLMSSDQSLRVFHVNAMIGNWVDCIFQAYDAFNSKPL